MFFYLVSELLAKDSRTDFPVFEKAVVGDPKLRSKSSSRGGSVCLHWHRAVRPLVAVTRRDERGSFTLFLMGVLRKRFLQYYQVLGLLVQLRWHVMGPLLLIKSRKELLRRGLRGAVNNNKCEPSWRDSGYLLSGEDI
ncbi:hypothetical protein RHMOL_Rhmol06G0033000 [Rhododendron molle]|uniref:Uncharacterized protein n=1 Tax=Rhododendron molle TaxID=49168 RepID=A0ACC0N8D5_RHOML|nr:hypothetical protein RHMOL_Rhmol06G0033000 [Rhododendron molle]